MWVVTGASGFVGAHVCRKLGSDARGLLRSDAPHWTIDELRAALTGAEGVVHCASVVHRPETPAEEYERFNVDGTRALVEAARAVGARRFVFISSIKVYGEYTPNRIDEKLPTVPDSHYAETKLRAERIALEAKDLKPIALRLAPVYGRGDKGNVRTMLQAIHRRRFLVPGDGSARKSIVHVSTVAEVVKAALRTDVTGPFVIADRVTPSIRELANIMSHIIGRARPLSIPRPALMIAADVIGRVARRLGKRTNLSRSLIEKATADSLCDPSAVERALGVTCTVDLDAALRDEYDWLRGSGLL